MSSHEAPLISVVVPTHDRAALLGECLESLASQSLPASAFEVVVVDDGSTDDTAAVCEAMSHRIALRSLRLAQSGIAAAKNAGLFASTGRLTLFFDDDDVADPDLLLSHVEAHHAYPALGDAILGHTTWAPWLEVTPVMEYVTDIGQQLFSYRDLVDGSALDFTYFWGGRTSVKRDFLTSRGTFNQDFTFGYEDIELGRRLTQHGLRVVYRRGAVSYMTRPVTFAEFCNRCERQGASLWRLSQMHEDPTIQHYCRVVELLEDWDVREPLIADAFSRVAELESLLRDVPKADRDEPSLLDELRDLYGWSFRALTAKGIAEAMQPVAADTADGQEGPTLSTDPLQERVVAR
jgi:glycosyltransferase involved in cell wall biosynthesis